MASKNSFRRAGAAASIVGLAVAGLVVMAQAQAPAPLKIGITEGFSGVYSSTLHYLKAVQAAGTDDAKAVMAKMREIPVNDVMTKNGKLREDGRLVRDMYLFEVKSPAESKSKDDIYKLIATVPGDQAYRPLKDGKCPFVK